jgi:hypothetical protein
MLRTGRWRFEVWRNDKLIHLGGWWISIRPLLAVSWEGLDMGVRLGEAVALVIKLNWRRNIERMSWRNEHITAK